MAERTTSAVAVSATGIGLIFLWAGIKGASVLTTLQELVQGKQPTGVNVRSIHVPDLGAATGAAAGNIAAAQGTAAQNQAIAKQLAAGYGWSTGSNWSSLVALWEHESSWSATSKNPSSGAYGIPQALPADKMASAGSDWRTNPATQIRWGLSYIKGRYGSPDAAWAFWQAHNWY